MGRRNDDGGSANRLRSAVDRLVFPEEPEIRADLLVHAERFGFRSSVGSPSTILLVVVVFWGAVPHAGLFAWGAVTMVGSVMQVAVHLQYRRERDTRSLDHLIHRRTVALFLGGTSWGLLPVFVRPVDRLEYQAIVCVFVVSFLAANTIFSSALRRFWLAFQVPAATVATIGFLSAPTSISVMLASIVAYALPFSAILHQQANAAEVGSVRLAHRNATLADELRDERTRIEDTNAELRSLNELLEHQVAHDHLTDLANRQQFHGHLTERLERTRRVGRGRVAVLFLDIDRFKFVNDSLGHATGDDLIVAVAERVQASLGPHDVLARLGGDEFTVLLGDLDDDRQAYDAATAIRNALREPFALGHRQVRVSASIGIAFDRTGTDSADDLLRHADSAMYHAKGNGRDRVEVFDDSLRASLARRIDEEHELRRAIELDQIVTWLQPEVDLFTGRILGAECLARWIHPERGVMSAGSFVTLAEESGLVHELAACTNRRAILARAELGPLVPADFRLRLNVSAAQLMYPEQLDEFLAALDAMQVDPRTVGFEVTETAIVNDIDLARRWLERARDAGITIALDDFGTGYSSLALLSQLPLDGVKIDLSFVRDMMTSTAARAVVMATVEIADVLDLQVVAEGVETPEQAAALREIGVHRAQGYLWSPAVPLGTLRTWLDDGAPWQSDERSGAGAIEALDIARVGHPSQG